MNEGPGNIISPGTTATASAETVSRERQLEIIFNASNDIIFLLSVEPGPDFRFTSVNQAFLAATGLKREMVEGRLVNEIIPEPSLSLALSNYRKAIADCEPVQWEETTVYPAGTKTGIVNIIPVLTENRQCSMLVGTVHDITARKNVQLEKERVHHLLNERVKELTTLYDVSRILQSDTRSDEAVLREVVSMLPSGWQYPEVTEACISFGEHQFHTSRFSEGVDKQSADFMVNGEKAGTIEIVYTEKKLLDAEGPFMAEERKMINMLAEMFGSYFSRKKATVQLTKEKELSESIINNLPGIFYLFDQTGQYLRWNKNHETITGYTTAEMHNMHPLNFIDEDEKQIITDRIQKVFTEGYDSVEAKFVTKNGKKIPYYFNGIAIEYEGRPCLMGVGFDMTIQKRIEEDLREAEIKFRTLVEKSLVGVYIVQDSKFTYVNPRFAEIFGYTPDELIGVDPVQTIISEEYRHISKEYVRARLKGEAEIAHYEVAGRKKDGTMNRVEFFGSRAIYAGEPTIIGTMIDITERKLAEEALQKSEANLHTVFDTTDTIYVLLDTSFCVMSFNHRAFDFVKHELGSELRLSTSLVNYFPKQRQAELTRLMKRVLKGKNISYESSYPQKDKSINWYHVRMFPIGTSQQKVFGMMIAVSDITEKKLLQQEIMNQKVQEQKRITRAVLNAQDKERNKIGQELHDNVNQILVGSKMYLGLLEKETSEKNPRVKQTIKLIDNAINEIRSLSRDQVTPQRKTDLKELVQSLIDNVNKHSVIKTKFVYDMGSVVIKDDLKLNIYRIIQECINNILKHAAAKNASFVIRTEGDSLRIMIIDDGRGFNVANTGTQGIGLSNILNRVESYNGHMNIKSNPGKGCKIELNIPV